MFPQLKSKGYRLELYYEDSLVGKITRNSDVKEALLAFSEEYFLSFRTIFVTECLKPEADAQCSKDQDMLPSK